MPITGPIVDGTTSPITDCVVGMPNADSTPSYLLLESGDKLVLEDGSGNLLLQ